MLVPALQLAAMAMKLAGQDRFTERRSIAAVLFFPAGFSGKREVRDGGAVRGLMSFRGGTDEANKIEVFLYI